MAHRREEWNRMGIRRAADLRKVRNGRRVLTAGSVIVRQRPGTAKGFVFLSLEDETGIANIIVTPDVFEAYQGVIVGEPYLLVEGTMQHLDGTYSVRAETVMPLPSLAIGDISHNFH
jgi:error-prone DNA polymerase